MESFSAERSAEETFVKANKKCGCRSLFGEDYAQLIEFVVNGLHLGNVVGHSRTILKADLEHAGDENGNSDCRLVNEAIPEILPNGVGGGIVVECVDKIGRGGTDEDADDISIGLLPFTLFVNSIFVRLHVSITCRIGRLNGGRGLFYLATVEEDVLEVQSLHVTAQEVLVNPVAPCLEVGARLVGFKAEWGDGVGEGGRGEGHDKDPFVSRAKRHS
ncbi:unnamed protein product [Closterium sp. NIES-54]